MIPWKEIVYFYFHRAQQTRAPQFFSKQPSNMPVWSTQAEVALIELVRAVPSLWIQNTETIQRSYWESSTTKIYRRSCRLYSLIWKDLIQVIQINSRDLFHALQMLFHFHIIAEMQNTCLMCGMRNQFSLWDITRAHTSFTEGYLGIITTLPSWWLFIVYIMPFGKKECCSGYNLMSIKIIHHPWPS